MLSPGFELRVGKMPELRPLPLRVPIMRGVAEGEHPFLGARLFLVAPRPAEGRIEMMALQRLLQALRLHDVGVEGAAMGDRRDAVAHALLIGMHHEIDAEPLRLAVAEGDHLAELPGGIDVQQRERRLRRIERLHGEMHHDRGVLADRIEHDRMVELRHHLAHDLNAFRLELAQIG